MPDHSTFSKNRHGRFRDSGMFRQLFETVLQRCMKEGLVGAQRITYTSCFFQYPGACWRAMNVDEECALNFNQAFCGVVDYAAVDKSTRL